jgi:hypothetical protein
VCRANCDANCDAGHFRFNDACWKEMISVDWQAHVGYSRWRHPSGVWAQPICCLSYNEPLLLIHFNKTAHELCWQMARVASGEWHALFFPSETDNFLLLYLCHGRRLLVVHGQH